jgi:hypothetical protein
MAGTYINAALTVLFAGLGITVFVKYMRVRKYIVIQNRGSRPLQVAFIVLMVLSALTLVTSHAWYDYIRVLAMIFACAAYIMVHEGMGPEGVVKSNSFIPWSEVRNWDTTEHKKKFIVYMIIGSAGKTKTAESDAMELDFALEQKKAVTACLKKYAARKYTRMKKS